MAWMRDRFTGRLRLLSPRIASTSSTVFCIDARASSAGAAAAGAASSSHASASALLLDLIQILLVLRARLGPVRDLALAVLQADVAHEDIAIDCLAAVFLDLHVVDRALIHDVDDADPEDDAQPEHGIARDVDRIGHPVAHRAAEREDRQQHVGARGRAPVADGLPEVLAVLLEPDLRGDVHEADDAHRGVDQEAPEVVAGVDRLRLEQVVQEGARQLEVAEEVVDAREDEAGHQPVPAARDGAEQVAVEAVVEVEDGLVVAAPGIRAVRGRARTPEQQQQQQQRAAHAAPGTPRLHSLASSSPPRSALWTSEPTSFSMLSALSVSPISPPELSSWSSAPGSSSMNWSPSRPAVRIEALVSTGSWSLSSTSSVTRARRSSASSIFVTLPTFTPEITTGARSASPPICAKLA